MRSELRAPALRRIVWVTRHGVASSGSGVREISRQRVRQGVLQEGNAAEELMARWWHGRIQRSPWACPLAVRALRIPHIHGHPALRYCFCMVCPLVRSHRLLGSISGSKLRGCDSGLRERSCRQRQGEIAHAVGGAYPGHNTPLHLPLGVARGSLQVTAWGSGRCGREWISQVVSEPKRCHKCKGPYWNKKRVRPTPMRS